MDVLCTDKTGTLTQGKIVLEKHLDVYGEPSDKVLQYGYLNSFHHTGLKNLLDEAILDHKELREHLKADEKYHKIDEIPFDFVRRRMSVVAVAERLKRAAVSRKLDIYFIVSLLYTASLTVVTFAFEYLGLEKARPGSFNAINNLGFWDFLGFSFNTIMTASVSPITPKSAVAQAMAHGELVAALLLLVILVFVVLTIIRERFREDVELTITEPKNGADLIEVHIQQQYKLTMPDVELKALASERPVVNLLRRFRGLREIEAEVVVEKKPSDAAQTPTGAATTPPGLGPKPSA